MSNKKICLIRNGSVTRKATLVEWEAKKLMAFIHQTPQEIEQKRIPPIVMFDPDGQGENGWEIDF